VIGLATLAMRLSGRFWVWLPLLPIAGIASD